MTTTIKDAFKYFMPFLILICLFFIYIQIKSSHKSNDITHISVSNGEVIQPKQYLISEAQIQEGYLAGDRFRYINFLSQKYPNLNITYNNKTVSVVIYSDNYPGFVLHSAGWMNANKKLYIPDDFSRLGKYGFEELYIDSLSYHSYRKFDKNSNYY